MKRIKIIGGGLAGCEAAYQLLKKGYAVDMYEMRPKVQTVVHKTDMLCELVCSNSLKSADESTSQGALKYELELLDSLILKTAKRNCVPAGGALAVDRHEFSKGVEKELLNFDNFNLIREECKEIDDWTIVASGPLTSKELADQIEKLLGHRHLAFYDAVAPIVEYSSIDREKTFVMGRYGKGNDYLNCPLSKEEYLEFVRELAAAERVIDKEFEKSDFFNACMPIEVMAKRGEDTLRFGSFRPVGLIDPSNGKMPYAVLQLRKEDNYNKLYNLVGCQTNMKFGEQKRVFGIVPALKNAEFVRYGVMHRNTFINSPMTLNKDFSLKTNPKVFFAGQITGVEGYMESCMSGLIAAKSLMRRYENKESIVPDEYTMIGSLLNYITTKKQDFQPMHASFSLVPPLNERIRNKKERKAAYTKRAVENIKEYIIQLER